PAGRARSRLARGVSAAATRSILRGEPGAASVAEPGGGAPGPGSGSGAGARSIGLPLLRVGRRAGSPRAAGQRQAWAQPRTTGGGVAECRNSRGGREDGDGLFGSPR